MALNIKSAESNDLRIIICLRKSGPKVMKLFHAPLSWLSMECEMLISMKVSRNSSFSRLYKPRIMLFFPAHKCSNCWHIKIYEQEIFHAQLS